MTICIAVSCNSSTCVIFASDRMMTSSPLSIQFEHDDPKFESLGTHCVALTSGEVTPPTQLFREARAEIQQKAHPSMTDICDALCRSFLAYRIRSVEEKYFKPRKLTIDQFLQIQSRLNDNVILRLDRAIETESLKFTIMVAGVDGSGAHVYQISDPGHAECFDRIGFNAIGSGLPHAISNFISHNYNSRMDLRKALYIVYEAKRDAERAPGVGRSTDMGYVSKDGIKLLSVDDLAKLEALYREKQKVEDEGLKKLSEMINELELGEAKK